MFYHFNQLTRISILPSQPRASILPVASVGTVFSSLHPERLRQARKGPALSLSGTGKPGIAPFPSYFSDTFPSPPSFARFGSASPLHSTRLAPATPLTSAARSRQ